MISREAIRRSGANSIVEALDWGFGVDLSPYSPALADVGIRGSTFEQVLVLVNGVRMRDGQTGHFNLNLSVPLEQVERIEILRGPAAALYGSDAMAGVINIITRSRAYSTSSLAVEGGSFGFGSFSASHRTGPIGQVSLDLGGSYDTGDGHRPGTDFDNRVIRSAIDFPVADEVFTLEFAHTRRAFGADGFYGAYPAFETTRTTTAVASGSARVGGRIVLEPSLRWRRNTDDFILYRDDPARYRNRHASRQLGGDLIARMELTRGVVAAAGLHASQDEITSIALGDHSERVTAVSVELTSAGRGNTGGSIGFRVERSPNGETLLAPAASVGLSATPNLDFRTSIGRAHRMPTWTERFYRDPVHQGGADLSWESAWSADAGVEYRASSMLSLSGSTFVRKEGDLIDWAKPADGSDPVWRTRNVDRATFRGLEMQAELAVRTGSRLRLEGSWLSLQSSSGAGFVSKYALRPQVESVGLILDQDVGDRLQMTVRGRTERRSGEASHFRLDGRVAAGFGQLKLFGEFRNGTDAEYLDVTQHAAPGRSVSLGLELRRGG